MVKKKDWFFKQNKALPRICQSQKAKMVRRGQTNIYTSFYFYFLQLYISSFLKIKDRYVSVNI
jgi:hypothetical protein